MTQPVTDQHISIVGARVHNLQNLSLQIPLGKWTAITGVSGSGKSSLTLDTIHAEGQRRYFETLSSSARLFLQQLERPDVDRIDHLPPSIAIGQSTRPETGTAQICDAVELLDHLALLAMQVGVMHCQSCHVPVISSDATTISQRIASLPEKTKFQIAFPLDANDETSNEELKKRWEQEGFHRFIDLKPSTEKPNKNQSDITHSLVLVDRLAAGQIAEDRLSESLEQAFSAGSNQCILLLDPKVCADQDSKQNFNLVCDQNDRQWNYEFYSQDRCCSCCYQKHPEIQPQIFRRSSPIGACQTCSGNGKIKKNKTSQQCNDCQGLGLNTLASGIHLAEKTMRELLEMSCQDLLSFINQSEFTPAETSDTNISEILLELRFRLNTLCNLGLGYLQANRWLTSLSSGEYQRISLSNASCSRLVNTLYIFDEPSSGLHQHDCQAVLKTIRNLRDQDNTVIMIEHNAEMISQVEHVVELGPRAGNEGGNLVFEGAYQDLLTEKETCTAKWLAEEARLAQFSRRPITPQTSFLNATGICIRNVQNASAQFPLQRMSVITGVSGSGKTSLLCDAIYPAIKQLLEEDSTRDQSHSCIAELTGTESIAEAVLVNDVAVARSIRSTPITYIKAFDEIRKLFAYTVDAQTLGFEPARFSFNSSAGGRCTHCSGNGVIEIDMHFLANQTISCPECKGKRFNPETLIVKYRGRNIHDVLSMSIDEAFSFFHNHQSLQRRLQMLREVGLGYLSTGQSLATLSGGEAQRLKLASFLSESSGKSKLYLFDEPTAGLHPEDVATLISCFRRLVEQGHTVIAIDHHLLMLEAADWAIDIGPYAAEQGGQILFQGLPSGLTNCKESITATYWKKHLDNLQTN